MVPIDSTTWKRLRELVVPFFSSEVKWKARGYLLLLVGLALAVAGMNVLVSFIMRDLFNALLTKFREEFLRKLLHLILAFSLATPIVTLYSYTEARMALLWRQWLSRRLLKHYFSDLAYYRVSWVEGIDNPDQRIEEDVRTFTQTSLSFFLILFNATLDFVLFINIMWSISFNLILAGIAYALFGSFMAYMVGRPLIRLSFEQLKREANYRYKLVNVRDNAESIAFYGGGQKENKRTRQRLKLALDNFRKIINVNRNLRLFNQAYDYLKPVLPVIVVSPLYLTGQIEFGVVYQSQDAFLRVTNALSIMVVHFGTISSLTAIITRLGSFFEAIELAEKNEVTPGGQHIRMTQAGRLAFERVTILTPKRDQFLVRELTLEVKKGGLLIAGPSGSGKSSILRAIAGLWDSGEGTIYRPPLTECMFIPQRPYMVLGSFRNQLLYGTKREGMSDRELERIVNQVGLDDTLRRVRSFDAVFDWPNILSTGEQQRLAFARLVLGKPKYVFLDEATTALDSASEARLYRIIETTTEAHVSIGYHITLAGYHTMTLDLLGSGEWTTRRSR